MTNENYRTERRRTFLLEDLPQPLTRASEHLQFFDNFIENTNLCLRTIRAPHTKAWTWILEKRELLNAGDLSAWKVSEIFLDEEEHKVFEMFEGREVKKNERVETNELRFNRYFFDIAGKKAEIDVYLNPLWGLITAAIYFDGEEEMRNFEMPEIAVAEITEREFFIGKNLVGKTFEDVRAEVVSLNIKSKQKNA